MNTPKAENIQEGGKRTDRKRAHENRYPVKEKQYRIGEEWQWSPEAKKLSDNNLKPREKRSYSFEERLNEKGSWTLIVRISKHRMSKEDAKYHELLGEYPLSVQVFKESYRIEVE